VDRAVIQLNFRYGSVTFQCIGGNIAMVVSVLLSKYIYMLSSMALLDGVRNAGMGAKRDQRSMPT
jgi:hypothetical protein